MFYRKTVLDNGITVITEHMDSVRSVSLGLWFGVGSRDERPEQAGMSHFMEHMMFKGTPTRSASQISEEFDRLGAELNAFTSKEYTCYYARLVDEKMPAALEILSDMVVNSLFAQECIDSEREVVIEEIARMEDTPDDFIHELFSASLFPDHTLGKPILGSRESVGSFTHDNCQAFHDEFYSTGNLVVAAAGNVDHDTLVALVSTNLAGLRVGLRAVRPAFVGADPVPLSVLKKDTEQAHIIVGMRGLPAGDQNRYGAGLMDMILGGGMSSRLFQEVREKRGLAYAVYSYSQPFAGVGQFCAYVGTRPSNAHEAVSIMIEEMGKVREAGVLETEMERVREAATGSLVLGMEATRSRMQRLGKYEVLGLEHVSLEDTIDRYRAEGVDHVGEIARDILGRTPSLTVIGPYEASEFAGLIG